MRNEVRWVGIRLSMAMIAGAMGSAVRYFFSPSRALRYAVWRFYP